TSAVSSASENTPAASDMRHPPYRRAADAFKATQRQYRAGVRQALTTPGHGRAFDPVLRDDPVDDSLSPHLRQNHIDHPGHLGIAAGGNPERLTDHHEALGQQPQAGMAGHVGFELLADTRGNLVVVGEK